MKELIKIGKQVKVVQTDELNTFGIFLVSEEDANINNIVEFYDKNFKIINIYKQPIEVKILIK